MAWLQHYFHYVIAGVLLALVFEFVRSFLVSGLKLGKSLWQAQLAFERIKSEATGPLVDLERIAREAMRDSRLAHAWDEFIETLHPQREVDAYGQERIVRYRATSMSGAFFTEQSLVETPLKTEFFKHLPGILTGVGIIGTFSGLIFGLIEFQVSKDADLVRASLAQLIQNVGHAFIVSGGAIFFAMVVTFVEKQVITRRFQQVERLCALIDSCFDAGAGEEYLARLVTAAEESATQSAQMKDSLVTDLKQILTELTNQQITASTHQTQLLQSAMVGAIEHGLAEPMNRISQGIAQVSSDQGSAVNNLLTEVLSAFTARIDDMFGQQMRGMNDALAQTSQAIQMAASKFDDLTSGFKAAGQDAAGAMQQRIEQMMHDAELRQQVMNNQMSDFVESIKLSLAGSQSASAQQQQELLANLGQQVSEVVAQLRTDAAGATAAQQTQMAQVSEQMSAFLDRMEKTVSYSQDKTQHKLNEVLGALSESTKGMIGSLGEQTSASMQAQSELVTTLAQETQMTVRSLADSVSSLNSAVSEATAEMRATTISMSQATRESVERMSRGSELINGASTSFAESLHRFSSLSQTIETVHLNLANATETMRSAMHANDQALQGYQGALKTFASMVADLRETVETAKREAGLTSELVAGLQSASQKLAAVQDQAGGYLQGVNEVLAESHHGFRDAIEKTLHHGNVTFHRELGEAVGLLKGAIQELGDTLDLAAAKR